jgi:hypothetical protein
MTTVSTPTLRGSSDQVLARNRVVEEHLQPEYGPRGHRGCSRALPGWQVKWLRTIKPRAAVNSTRSEGEWSTCAIMQACG